MIVLLAYLIELIRDRDWLDDAFNAELLRDDHSGLLPNHECGPERVRTNIAWRDRHVGNFEPAYAIHVKLRVDDAAQLARFHRTRAKLMDNHKCNRVGTRNACYQRWTLRAL
jgi:hypothetical protein